ncbi:MAG: MATE family efflux transporter [Paludibacteraceae bacterium]|nr:MATE family efflux transporter [Paludibacteraceae bacterium]
MSSHTELGTERIRVLLVKYALPAIVAMTATSLYNIVDSIFIGHGVGAMALSGLTIAKPFMDICAAFGSLVGVGAGALVAIKLGERNYQSAQKVLGNVMMLNIVLSVLVMVIGIAFLNPILRAFGASDQSLPLARDYMLIILIGNVPTHIYFGLNNVLRSAGHPYMAMSTTIFAVLLNIVLDPIFIFALDMGVRGAALATVLSQCAAVLWQIVVFNRPHEVLHFQRSMWHFDWPIVRDIFSIGLSPFLMHMAQCLVIVLLNNQLMRFGGDMAIAAYGVINRMIFVFCMVVFGLNQGMQPIAGYNYGARQYDRMMRVFKLTAYAATAITTLVFLVGELCPGLMVQIFTHDAELIALSVQAMRIVVCVFFCVGFQMVTGNFFTSIGMAKKAIFLSLSRQVLCLVPLIWFLPSIMVHGAPWGLNGVWWCMPISDALSAFLAAWLLMRQLRIFNQLHLDQQQLLNLED